MASVSACSRPGPTTVRCPRRTRDCRPGASTQAQRPGARPAAAHRPPTATATTAGSSPDAGWEVASEELSVTGLVEDPPAILGSASTVLVPRAQAEAWAAAEPGGLRYDEVLVAGAAGTDDEVAEAVRAVLPRADVRTAVEEAEARTAELTGQAQTLTYFVLAFAAVAMFVAALVIANTFQVLVAQRARTLALLRCVGATKAQVHRSVLLEAGVLGVVASLAGLVLGLALGQGALWFLQGADLGVEVAETVPLTVPLVTVPLLTGTAVTVLAALAPARTATRVAPCPRSVRRRTDVRSCTSIDAQDVT
ncbi:FtsX-like permease family protein [Georgenia sp. SUBG003]|uniref:FtsX-like permease family protein n=1 Tax=Georgenia sp. SUBG003 TaxID=1497974 RepID=UPI003AB6EDF8